MKDFYSFGVFFADVEERAVGQQSQVALPTEEQSSQLATLDQQLAELRTKYNESPPEYVAVRDAMSPNFRTFRHSYHARARLSWQWSYAITLWR
jgi:molybdopterin converting factor small subunit